jgi:hypothetical protein
MTSATRRSAWTAETKKIARMTASKNRNDPIHPKPTASHGFSAQASRRDMIRELRDCGHEGVNVPPASGFHSVTK